MISDLVKYKNKRKERDRDGLHTDFGGFDEPALGGVLSEGSVRVAPEGAGAYSEVVALREKVPTVGRGAAAATTGGWSAGGISSGTGTLSLASVGQCGHNRPVPGPVHGILGPGEEVRRCVQHPNWPGSVSGGEQPGADPGGAEPERALLRWPAGLSALPPAVWRRSQQL